MGRMLDALKQIEDSADKQVFEQPAAAMGGGPEAELSFPDDLLSDTAALLDELEASESAEPATVEEQVVFEEPTAEQPEVIISDVMPRGERWSRDPRHVDLAANILGQLPAADSVSLFFAASAGSGVYATSLAPLFLTLAQRVEGRTLVVECDFSRAALAGCFVIEPKFGLSDVLSSLATWPSAVAASKQSGLDVLCSHTARSGAAGNGADGNGFEQFGLEHQRSIFASMLAEIREQYRLVLLENVSATDSQISQLAAFCHGTYLMLRAGQTPRDSARQSVKTINRAGAQVLGCVLLDA